MSASTEVQRTLVKSPPELWAELSDPAALARHLSELGDVRITRTEPERAVDWEAVAARRLEGQRQSRDLADRLGHARDVQRHARR